MMSSDRISSNHLKPPIFACRVHRWIINSVPTPFLFFSATTTHDPSIYLHRLSILSVRCFSMTDPAIFILISSDDFVDRVFFFFCEKITTSSESTAEPHVAHLYGKYDFPVFPHIYIRLAHARFPTNTPYVETLRSIPTKTPPLPVRTFLPTRCTTITLLEHFFSFLPFFMSYFYRHTHHELPTVDHRQRRASLLFFRRFYSFVLSVILRMTPGRILLH